ncbi:hypothetical protein HYW94_02945 [Candidatus Uhrbacteria bacterium]|nr:hypothetical protein [Candidatus Uhrbacteria bacterium]
MSLNFDPDSQRSEKEAPERSPSFEFRDIADARSYLEWKQRIPQEIRDIVEGTMKGAAMPDSFTPLPLTNEFLTALSSQMRDPDSAMDVSGYDERVKNLLEPLAHIKTKEGFLNAFKAFADPAFSWSFKKDLYELQIKSSVDWLVSQDLEALSEKRQEEATEEEDGQSRETEQQPAPDDDVPPPSEEVRSSMESGMEKREGEPKPLFTVRPFYGGYYKSLAFDRFDPATLSWGKPENEFHDPEYSETAPIGKRILSGKVTRGAPLALPLPYDWTCEVNSLVSGDESAEVVQNQDGHWYLDIPGKGIASYEITIAKKTYREEGERMSVQQCAIEGSLPSDILKTIQETKASRLASLAKARLLVKKVREHLTYSNNSKAYAEYTKNPQKYFEAIWKKREADCYVANTAAARVLTEAGITCRFISGYFSKEKGEKDEAILHAGNGHAWLEVYDVIGRRWVRLDATPKGDPNMDEETQEQDLSGEGDFGENENEMASEEDVEKKIKELEKQQGQQEGKSQEYSTADERFAEMAECTPAQAREYARALERVREIKDETDTPIVERLIDEWKKIVQEFTREQSDYRGPVRMDEGDRFEDPAAAKIDVKAGEYNPTGFEKEFTVEKTLVDFGGLNIYFSFDLSGSMLQPDPASSRPKADVQRDVGLLFVDSLMQCAFVSRQMGSQDVSLPIKIMVTVASQQGRVQLPLTDRWGPKEQWAFYTALAQCATGGTPIHQTLDLIEQAFDKEVLGLKKKQIPAEKQPVHYIAEVTDGSPNDVASVLAHHRSMKEKKMAVRAYIIGEKAPPSYGEDAADPIESFSQLPLILAKDIITQFKKLKPRRIKL